MCFSFKKRAFRKYFIIIFSIVSMLLSFGCSKSSNQIEMDKELKGIVETSYRTYAETLTIESSDEKWVEEFTSYCETKKWSMKECKENVLEYKEMRKKFLSDEEEKRENSKAKEKEEKIKLGYIKDYKKEALYNLLNYRYLSEKNMSIGEHLSKQKLADMVCDYSDRAFLRCKIDGKEFSWYLHGADLGDFESVNFKGSVYWAPSSEEAEKQFEEITNTKLIKYLFNDDARTQENKIASDKYLASVKNVFEKIQSINRERGFVFNFETSQKSFPRENASNTIEINYHLSKTDKENSKNKVYIHYDSDISIKNVTPNERVQLFIGSMNKQWSKLELQSSLSILFSHFYKNEMHGALVAKDLFNVIQQLLPKNWKNDDHSSISSNCSKYGVNIQGRTISDHSRYLKSLGGDVNITVVYPCGDYDDGPLVITIEGGGKNL